MKIVIFGLSISSSWGNGHATLWRGLCRALEKRGHSIVFFEKDEPYYREARDLWDPAYARLVLYPSWSDVRTLAAQELADADVGIVTSFCPDARTATELLLSSRCELTAFYDLDTPVTLAALEQGERPAWLTERGLSGFDLVLSFTGGTALKLLKERLGASRVVPLYGHVDPELHRPVPGVERYRGQLSYLGTFSEDRRTKVQTLLLDAAREAPEQTFVLGGSMYPDTASFPRNVLYLPHVEPADHAAFFCSSALTLNVTRKTMGRLGFCPSGRLFEASACGAPIVSDWFEGLDQFFEPGEEVLVAERTEEVLWALALSDYELSQMARRARERTLAEHTSQRRALELERYFEQALSSVVETPAFMEA